MDAAMDRVMKGEPAPSAPAAAQTPAAAAAAKRLLKLKLLDDKEEELDLDETYADETRRGALVADIQKGRNYDRAVEKARKAAEEAATHSTVEAQRRAWNAWINKQNFDVVADPSAPDGWKLVSKQSTTTADAELDPLTKEAEALQKKCDAGDGEAADFRRLAQIDAETLVIKRERKQRADSEAVAAKARADAAAATRATQQTEAYERAKADVIAETKKVIAARTKSFEGPGSDRLTARLTQDAVVAAEAAAKAGKPWADILAAAKAVVEEEANSLDARAAHWRANLPGAPAAAAAAPIIGATPSGGGGSPKYRNIDEAYDAVSKQMAARR
jgi:hypothetical protein